MRNFLTKSMTVVAFAAALSVAIAACTTAGASKEPQAQREPTAAEVKAAADEALLQRQHEVAVWNWTVASNANQVAAWYAAAYWQDIARLRLPPPPPPPPATPPRRQAAPPAPPGRGSSGGSSVGGACGGSKYDYVIPKESGGNPNARNASGAWGCYQIMPGTWAGAGCAGTFGSASTAEQAACADKLSAGAWVASQGR